MRYKTIVVGGGSAGSVLAARLSEDADHSVLLLEAGPDFANETLLPDELRFGQDLEAAIYGRYTWGYFGRRNASSPDVVPVPRGRVIGGSSSINGQVIYRGLPEDFAHWVDAGNTDWSFDSVLGYFRKFETDSDLSGQWHGSDGPIPVRRFPQSEWLPHVDAFYQACRSAGFDHDPDQNNPYTQGVGARPFNSVDGRRISMSIGYLDPIRDRENLTVQGDSLVHRVLFEGTRAVGVEIGDAAGTRRVDADEVVLCAGAIGSPQLLMRSGIGPSEHLTEHGIRVLHGLPGVGGNLRDHPGIFVLFQATAPMPVGEVPPIQVALRCSQPGSTRRNELQISPILMNSEHRPAAIQAKGDHYFGVTIGLMCATSAGSVRLASPNPTTPPIIDFNYLTNEVDLERLRYGVRLVARLMAAREFVDIVKTRLALSDTTLRDDDALNDWLRANVTTQHHASGTCAMGPATQPDAVVDQHGRVHGISGLRIVDASIMPDVVTANTHATTIMMAERLADWMRSKA